MSSFKPVSISKGGFQFCRAVIAALVTLSLLPRCRFLLLAVFAIMALSALLKVRRAPLILFYRYTVERLRPSENVVVDEKGIFFSHVVGAVFSLLCILAFRLNAVAGMIATCLFAILQISAACGFCSALKLYTCLTGGNCCRFGRRVKNIKDKSNA